MSDGGVGRESMLTISYSRWREWFSEPTDGLSDKSAPMAIWLLAIRFKSITYKPSV